MKRGKAGLFFLLLCISGIIFFLMLPPTELFHQPHSTILEDRNGNLLGAAIATDGQWRFPATDSVPNRFSIAITNFEDQYFQYHFGVNPLAIARAAWQNFSENRIVSGGSTLTMQVIRLSRGQNRTFWEKIKEIFLSIRLEFHTSKDQILGLYAAHAPFGGNVVGLEAAAWRYFSRPPQQLSWAETALLAVLPNSPSLIYPGKNQEILKKKRDRLLHKLLKNKYLDSLTYQLALNESIPGLPQPLPNLAPHLLTRAIKEGKKGQRIQTTLKANLQKTANQILFEHHKNLEANQIHNGAVLIVDVESGNTLAYVGNTTTAAENNPAVDVITAPRSTGSILKPFLYAAMLNEGDLMPQTLIPDIPTLINGYAPQNFNKKFEGVVPANEVISRSLNVPAVHMLRNYGVEKLHFLLKNLGMTTLNYSPSHYGLSLILGGAEANLWDLTSMYAGLARTLNHYNTNPHPFRYNKDDYHPNSYELSSGKTEIAKPYSKEKSSWLKASSIWFTYQAMQEVNRPDEETGWDFYQDAPKLAWKTGTSFGFRDGWAIGVTPKYVIAVWVGNADGEGRPGLTGTTAAAPILFDIANKLPRENWFKEPKSEMTQVQVCSLSGYRASTACEDAVNRWVPTSSLISSPCPYHQLIHLDETGKFQASSACVSVNKMLHKSWFVLPAVQEWYYKINHPLYKPLPPFNGNCQFSTSAIRVMDVIYPENYSKIYVPIEIDGKRGKAIFEATHRNQKSEIFWHLDDQYLGTTTQIHQMEIAPGMGWHTLTLVDENGETLTRKFEVLAK